MCVCVVCVHTLPHVILCLHDVDMHRYCVTLLQSLYVAYMCHVRAHGVCVCVCVRARAVTLMISILVRVHVDMQLCDVCKHFNCAESTGKGECLSNMELHGKVEKSGWLHVQPS